MKGQWKAPRPPRPDRPGIRARVLRALGLYLLGVASTLAFLRYSRWTPAVPGFGRSTHASAGGGGGGALDLAQQVNVAPRKKLLAFVGVNTGFGSAARRKVLRETWFPSTPQLLEEAFDSSGLLFRFVIGQTNDKAKEAQLQEEVKQYDDFMRLDVLEGYADLNRKTLVYFRTVFKLYDAAFYVKADDDIYLRPDRLGLLLARERKNPRTYLGCLKHGNVITDKKYKWYEPQGSLLGKEYFLHAYGPIYALSQDVVHTISTIRDGTLRMFMNEDVTVGSWMLALDVEHEHTLDLCSATCTSTFIAVFDLPTCSGLCEPLKKMPELHSDPKCSGTKASAFG